MEKGEWYEDNRLEQVRCEISPWQPLPDRTLMLLAHNLFTDDSLLSQNQKRRVSNSVHSLSLSLSEVAGWIRLAHLPLVVWLGRTLINIGISSNCHVFPASHLWSCTNTPSTIKFSTSPMTQKDHKLTMVETLTTITCSAHPRTCHLHTPTTPTLPPHPHTQYAHVTLCRVLVRDYERFLHLDFMQILFQCGLTSYKVLP